MPPFNKNGKGLIKSTASLWEILRDATEDPKAGPVIIVLDALDECAESEFENLMQNVKSQFRDSHVGSKLKYLLTCRPYEQITSQFHSLLNSFPDIRIPGEEESEAISQEINHVITHRINQLSIQKNLTSEIKSHLTTKLQSIPHRTYLWVYLIFKHLEEGIYKKTKKGIESTIATLPSSISEAYERILNKSKERQAVEKALSIVLAAHRPLTVAEMNVATSLVETSQNTYDLDMEDTESFKLRIRSLCGLFITIHHNKVYFIHQTAREFLLADTPPPAANLPSWSWQRSVSLRRAHTTLAELCVIYLDLFNSNDEFLRDIEEIRLNNSNFLDFLDYAAENWVAHFREADISDDATILPLAMRNCDSHSKSYSLWLDIMGTTTNLAGLARKATELVWASFFGLTAVAKLCLEKECHIEAGDYYGRTPLFLAASGGYEGIVKILLEKGAAIEVRNESGETPLHIAVSRVRERIVKILLDKGADTEARDEGGETPLWQAIFEGREEIVKMLLEKGAAIEARDKYGRTSLWHAVFAGHEEIVKMLLEKGADTEARDKYGETSLCHAAEGGHEKVVKILLEKGADIKAADDNGETPLWQAILESHEEIIKMLLDKGADFNARDKYDRMPLRVATIKGYKAVCRILHEKGVNFGSMDIAFNSKSSLSSENSRAIVANTPI